MENGDGIKHNDGKDKLPLVLDVDGTLVLTDLSLEHLLNCLWRHPLKTMRVLLSKRGSRAAIKDALFDLYTPDMPAVDFDERVVALAKKADHVVLASGSHIRMLEALKPFLPIKTELFGSEGNINLVGEAKAALLVEKFGYKKFDYAGNSYQDLPVFAVARHSILVNTPKNLHQKLPNQATISEILPRKEWTMKDVRGFLTWPPVLFAGLFIITLFLLQGIAFFWILPMWFATVSTVTLIIWAWSRRRLPPMLRDGTFYPQQFLVAWAASWLLIILFLLMRL